MEDNSSLMKPDPSDHQGAVGVEVGDLTTGRDGVVEGEAEDVAEEVGRDTEIKLTVLRQAE
jgi:hypothetical protein